MSAGDNLPETHMFVRLDTPDKGRIARRLATPAFFSEQIRFNQGRIRDVPALSWLWIRETPPPDRVPTVDSARLVSTPIKDVLEANLGPADEIQWLPATVQRESDGTVLP